MHNRMGNQTNCSTNGEWRQQISLQLSIWCISQRRWSTHSRASIYIEGISGGTTIVEWVPAEVFIIAAMDKRRAQMSHSVVTDIAWWGRPYVGQRDLPEATHSVSWTRWSTAAEDRLECSSTAAAASQRTAAQSTAAQRWWQWHRIATSNWHEIASAAAAVTATAHAWVTTFEQVTSVIIAIIVVIGILFGDWNKVNEAIRHFVCRCSLWRNSQNEVLPARTEHFLSMQFETDDIFYARIIHSDYFLH